MQLIFQRPFKVAFVLILLVVLGRWYQGGMDFTYFATIGEEFVVSESETKPFVMQEGPGYDGQFFFRIARDPFEFLNNGEIHLDHPAYRHQRIIYPTIASILSFGNNECVGFTLVLTNILTFLLLHLMINRFCKIYGIIGWPQYAALLISGFWMSLGRDLAELTEGMFLLFAFWQLENRRTALFSLFAFLALFTRETSAIVLLPVAAVWMVSEFWNKKQIQEKVLSLINFGWPFVLLALWKYSLSNIYSTPAILEGTGNFTYPFYGIYISARELIGQLEDVESVIEFLIWSAFLIWSIWFAFISSKALNFRTSDLFDRALSYGWLFSLLIALHFSHSIFIDDWSHQRVLGGFFLVCLLLVISKKIRLPNAFILASVLLAISTVGRLLIRV